MRDNTSEQTRVLNWENWELGRQGKDRQDDPNYASRTYASETSRHLAQTQTLGKLLFRQRCLETHSKSGVITI